ncbi:DUF1700 domain-containing protein [Methylococcus sp. EFPC2]|uniref:DUF1700 domain-containing protein n=1 Tax=Methylococcus sp. EFPC2 TaxID=2812648 RepID=UPI0019684103|nr:DUF1700 domain-containing protein [Methylococcus sp. EFPC2]QSA97468.1 DUF1700 domain-containing protein [Methylococcus sp. EFPC2]
MTRLEYLQALERALAGLPPAEVAELLADYEQHFADGLASGRNEADIALGLGDPKKAAAELRAVTRMEAFQREKSLASLGHLIFALVLLLVFNLFLAFPIVVFASLLLAFYAVAVALYVGGIVVTAVGLLEATLNVPVPWLVTSEPAALTGIEFILGGIVLLLLSLSVSRYALIGAVHYVRMNASLLQKSREVETGDIHSTK